MAEDVALCEGGCFQVVCACHDLGQTEQSIAACNGLQLAVSTRTLQSFVTSDEIALLASLKMCQHTGQNPGNCRTED